MPLLVCGPQLSVSDREELARCGASSWLVPRNWSDEAVAERVLAEFIAASDVEPASFGNLRGATEPMRELYQDIDTVAPTSEPVLILGETGTGKELAAQEVHRCSGRTDPLISINCAALTPELLESELFGHERGAFSGAIGSRKGLLAEAGQGTVFLDEIGDLAPSAQAKLLRVLEERKVRPVGSNRWQPIHARIVLATHRDLEAASQNGGFRQDLYERIRGFALHLPPLREHRADLILLIQHFVEEYNRDYPGNRTIPSGALDPLFRYDWPGNVRELRQAIRRAAASARDMEPISLRRLSDAVQRRGPVAPLHTVPFDPAADTWRAVQDRTRSLYFHSLLRQTRGNKEDAARRAGLSRSQLYEILKQIEQVESVEPEGEIPKPTK